ncbi:uncharacterized protein LOC133777714 isoform X3 [Humulus lupulus]|uniref:uncharacterized protein LOC133777714 isoform X3 n=1 Tax=Humulus lupulus TaxID=3486 RepID=UPI002B4106D3|nr:uncharacterized protein LOC133777714 isoform X3 [Humulus lupulus]
MASAKIKNLLVDLEKRFFEQAQRIEGNNGNAGDAIMLDYEGFVYETNATNIFVVKKGHVLTPHADYCLPGITRATVSCFTFYLQIALTSPLTESLFHMMSNNKRSVDQEC